jgi:hypothetical protein
VSHLSQAIPPENLPQGMTSERTLSLTNNTPRPVLPAMSPASVFTAYCPLLASSRHVLLHSTRSIPSRTGSHVSPSPAHFLSSHHHRSGRFRPHRDIHRNLRLPLSDLRQPVFIALPPVRLQVQPGRIEEGRGEGIRKGPGRDGGPDVERAEEGPVQAPGACESGGAKGSEWRGDGVGSG